MHQFPEAPRTWEELVSLRSYLIDCSVLFLRFEKDQITYKRETDNLPRSVVLDRVLKQMGGKRLAILPNKYPHTFVLQNLPKVSHFCLWSIDGDLDDRRIKEEIEMEFPNKVWMNMTRAQGKFSIPEIWHTHVYINDL